MAESLFTVWGYLILKAIPLSCVATVFSEKNRWLKEGVNWYALPQVSSMNQYRMLKLYHPLDWQNSGERRKYIRRHQMWKKM